MLIALATSHVALSFVFAKAASEANPSFLNRGSRNVARAKVEFIAQSPNRLCISCGSTSNSSLATGIVDVACILKQADFKPSATTMFGYQKSVTDSLITLLEVS